MQMQIKPMNNIHNSHRVAKRYWNFKSIVKKMNLNAFRMKSLPRRKYSMLNIQYLIFALKKQSHSVSYDSNWIYYSIKHWKESEWMTYGTISCYSKWFFHLFCFSANRFNSLRWRGRVKRLKGIGYKCRMIRVYILQL